MAKKLVTLGMALLMISILSLSSFAATKAYPWVQSKTQWCWATVAKAMIDTRTGVDVPSDYTQYNDQTGIRTDYCLYSGGKYLTDRAQEYIVRTYKKSGTDFTGKDQDNLSGNTTEITAAVAGMTGKGVKNYGEWKTAPFADVNTRTQYIDDKLVVGSKEICGNAYSYGATAETSKGHSLLIVEITSAGNYKTWNSWANTYVTYTPEQLFSTGFNPTPFNSTKLYMENVVYFTS